MLTTEQMGIVYNNLPGGKVDQDDYDNSISIEGALLATLARELEEELGLSREQFMEHVSGITKYFAFATLTKFNKENPLSEVVFYSLLPDEVLEKLDFRGQIDTKILHYNWSPLKEILDNFKIEDRNKLLPQGVYIFIDNHIPGILEKLSKKLSSEESD